MNLNDIPVEKLMLKPVEIWNEWLLLTAGDYTAGEYNAMTIAWGSMGMMWGRPFVQVVVRPTRHTLSFMNRYDSFTVCGFGTGRREALSLLGSKSGRDGDKIAESGLTPVAATNVAAPAFAEAELVIECTKAYTQQFDPAGFVAEYIEKCYNDDYHWAYFGEIAAVRGVSSYVR